MEVQYSMLIVIIVNECNDMRKETFLESACFHSHLAEVSALGEDLKQVAARVR